MQCPNCRLPQDFNTRRKIKGLVGPWFVYDRNNPSAPGVCWEKFSRMIDAGKIGPTGVVRGPTTGGLWRYAAATQVVAARMGLCHACAGAVEPSDTTCPDCGVALEYHGDSDNGTSNGGAEAQDSAIDSSEPESDLEALSAVSAWHPIRRLPPRRMVASVIVAMVLTAGLVSGAWWLWLRSAGPWSEQEASGGGVKTADSASGIALPVVPPAASRTAAPPDRVSRVGPVVPPVREGPIRPSPATRAAPPEVIPNRQAEAEDLYAAALDDERADRLRSAEGKLLRLLAHFDEQYWPAGAKTALTRVQAEIKSRPAGPSFYGLRG